MSQEKKRKPASACNSKYRSNERCRVCGDESSGFLCGCFVCEACKKFFVRSCKRQKKEYCCLKNQCCEITQHTRTKCQYCRYQKCLQLNMYAPGDIPKRDEESSSMVLCQVCGACSSGYHFGAITCEGCKGFFRRMARDQDLAHYTCEQNNKCNVTVATRKVCRCCRYKKCLEQGMSLDGSRIGRTPNAIKHSFAYQQHHDDDSGGTAGNPSEFCSLNDLDKMEITSTTDKLYGDSNTYSNQHSSVLGLSTKNDDGYSQMNCSTQIADSTDGHSSSVITDTNLKTPLANAPEKETSSKNNAKNWESGDSSYRFADLHSEKVVPQKSLSDSMSMIELKSIMVTAGMTLTNVTTRCPKIPSSLSIAQMADKEYIWKIMMEQFFHQANIVIKFAKKLPGFRQLDMDCQAALMMNSIYPIVILNHSYDNAVAGSCIYFCYNKYEEFAIMRHFPVFLPLVDHFVSIGEAIHDLQLTEQECTYLSALMVYSLDKYPDVMLLQEKISESLEIHETETYDNGAIRFGALLLRLGKLGLIGYEHNKIMQYANELQPPNLEFSRLFHELFL